MPFEFGGWLLDNFSSAKPIMKKHLTDCYFYFYSKCTRPNCQYRHEPAALGHEIVCGRWLQNNCFNKQCPNRHSIITKQRTKMQCYFESTPTGCTKPHCVFLHSQPRNNNVTSLQNQNMEVVTVTTAVQVLDINNQQQQQQQQQHQQQQQQQQPQQQQPTS